LIPYLYPHLQTCVSSRHVISKSKCTLNIVFARVLSFTFANYIALTLRARHKRVHKQSPFSHCLQ
jgi:hypothetical protein